MILENFKNQNFQKTDILSTRFKTGALFFILEKYSKLDSGKGKENFNGAVDRISAMANE